MIRRVIREDRQEDQLSSKVISKSLLKFGEFLQELKLIDESDLSEILNMSSQVRLPLGQALMHSGKISEQELKIALQLHEFAKTLGVPTEVSRKAFNYVCYDGIPIVDAIEKAGWAPPTPPNQDINERSKLGQLLFESGFINEDQLHEATSACKRFGLPIGRVVIMMGAISHADLARALDIQAMLRTGKINEREATEYLTAHKTTRNLNQFSPQQASEKDGKKVFRLGEFLILAGILTETDLMNAVEESITREQPFGKVLISLGLLEPQQLQLALKLQHAIKNNEETVQGACNKLQETFNAEQREWRKSKQEKDGETRQPNNVLFGDLLKMAGLVSENDVTKALEMACQQPSVLGRLLILAGSIDESILLSTLRTQYLLTNGQINIDGAVRGLRYAEEHKVSLDDALDQLGINVG
jgi:hypothetical protein